MEETSVQHRQQEKQSSSSPSINLRPFDLSDIDHYMIWATDDRATQFLSWDAFTNKEDVLDYMKKRVIPHPWMRAICIDGRPIGAISITPGSGSDRCRCALGYVLASKYWGQGIATVAVKMVINSIFSEWPHLERVEAMADVENHGSQRVLEKAGFLREGILRKYFISKGKTRDVVIYSFLSTDPKPILEGLT